MNFKNFISRKKTNVYIDIGSSNTLIFLDDKGLILNEPTVCAVKRETNLKNRVLAVGEEARSMIGRTPGSIETIRAIKNGAIGDYSILESLIKEFFRKTIKFRILLEYRFFLITSDNLTEVEKRAFLEVTKNALPKRIKKKIFFIDKAFFYALPFLENKFIAFLDIGAQTLTMNILNCPNPIYSKVVSFESEDFDTRIINYFRSKHGLLVGGGTAEKIKISMGEFINNPSKQFFKFKSRCLMNGIPRDYSLSKEDVEYLFQSYTEEILKNIEDLITNAKAFNVYDDIKKNGLILTGGGSRLEGLETTIRKKFNVPIKVIDKEKLDCYDYDKMNELLKLDILSI